MPVEVDGVRVLVQAVVEPGDEVRVEFGLAVTTKGNVVVVGAEAEASVKASITYDRPPRPRAVGGP